MKEEFERMPFNQKVSYLIENLSELPDDLAESGVEILAEAGEVEHAVLLAREKGMIDKAIAILVDGGDYLWAALTAKNAGNDDLSHKLYREGLNYYIKMEMFGRAISAASALGLSAEEIDDLYRRGIASESRGIDLSHTREMIDCAMQSLDLSLIGRDDELSRQVMKALAKKQEKRAREE